jgi:hypothetical protein
VSATAAAIGIDAVATTIRYQLWKAARCGLVRAMTLTMIALPRLPPTRCRMFDG